MGKLTLYGIDLSPPVRSVLLTLKALGLPFEYKVVNLLGGDHLKPEFLKMNPLHTVPTLDDDGFYLYDSHAINTYLVAKYGKDDSLYPKDLQQRAIVDQRLHYDSSVIGSTVRAITYPLIRENQTEIPQAKIDALSGVYESLNTFLKTTDYLAGNNLTIADFSVIAVLSGTPIFLEVDARKFPNLAGWVQRIKKLPYYEEVNGSKVSQFTNFIKSKNFKIV
ncbi:glutathione S-transferase 1 [Drosophila guanche]|uniref:Blast:Glutathione S-transferase 1 n=1 Tax=Drosophila guanche TaxID=7266 RepID=A0A3B0J3F8_DROGU|nr:glutathione S-transferase 1 [Drosophila guanche]SPP75875.1 blast:Glutathione S-transferase 1 [Drosophila guanche]